MSENRSALRIHTQLTPDPPAEPPRRKPRAAGRRSVFSRNPADSGEPRDVCRASRPAKSGDSVRPARAADREIPDSAPGRPRISSHSGRKRSGRARRRLSAGDRLLKNSAIACAVLLGVLALGNIDQPWAEKAAEGIERALTMHIDLDESIGELTFVREIMPESALVFLNVSGGAELTRPVDGSVTHAWNELQPWLVFQCENGAPVFAADAGTVSAVSPLSDGRFGLLIDHGEGRESVYAGLAAASVQTGDEVARGQQLGTAADALYYEYRRAGESVDPAGKMGL